MKIKFKKLKFDEKFKLFKDSKIIYIKKENNEAIIDSNIYSFGIFEDNKTFVYKV